jgi:Rubisco LSMT substrate-binding
MILIPACNTSVLGDAVVPISKRIGVVPINPNVRSCATTRCCSRLRFLQQLLIVLVLYCTETHRNYNGVIVGINAYSAVATTKSCVIRSNGEAQQSRWQQSSWPLLYEDPCGAKIISHSQRRMRLLSSTSSSSSKKSGNDSIDQANAPSSSSSSSKPQNTTTTTTPLNRSRNSLSVRQELLSWATTETQSIQISPSLNLRMDESSKNDNAMESLGYGWYANPARDSSSTTRSQLSSGQVVLSVPSSVALVVESTSTARRTRSDTSRSDSDNTNKEHAVSTQFPWYVQMALQLCDLDEQVQQADKSREQSSSINNNSNQKDSKIDYRPWIQSLPRQFDTPLHWTDSTLDQLQYPFLQSAVQRQRIAWRQYYETYCRTTTTQSLYSYDQFVWGCECARSRAFAGSYAGNAYNPKLFFFAMFLVAIYTVGQFGTIEQAANGAGMVLAASIVKDFVLPKLYKTKRYVICPMIDMTNHNSKLAQGEVAFEYFANAYSLSIQSNMSLQPNEQLFISYGTRSNDQLLQYYGFVEVDNPHDVYVMPPLREWDITALEAVCGRTFQPGRLQQLNDAGLLGGGTRTMDTNTKDEEEEDDDDTNGSNAMDGVVVISRSIGLDPAIVQALRVLVSTDEEWIAAGRAIGNFSVQRTVDNERCAVLVAITALDMELTSKATTIEDDQRLLKRMDTMQRMVESTTEDRLAVQFRTEKKRLLMETIEQLKEQLRSVQ